MAYVAVDRRGATHEGPHPGDKTDATGRSVLFGLLQLIGAELFAHESITAEQDTWASTAQHGTSAAAQHDRWVTLVRASGLTDEAIARPTRSGHWPSSSAAPSPTTMT